MADVVVRRDGPVATVALDRPTKFNALTEAMWCGVRDAFLELDADATIRVVVLTGEGDHFCAGADIEDLDRRHNSPLVPETMAAISTCHKPVLAVVSGFCLGGGVLLAAACDLRIASSGSRFGVPPAMLGVVYPETATRRLLSLIGPAATKYLIFTADRIDATRALHLGLVDEIVPPDLLADRGRHVAEQIAGLSQLTVQATKETVDAMVEGRDVAALIERWVAEADAGPDLAEGRSAFLDRRPGVFTWTRPERSRSDS